MYTKDTVKRMESTGNYSVRSAYRLLQAQKGRWQRNDNASLWGKMWKVKAPPKVLNLIWRTLSYCLPTMTALAQKKVDVICVCPVCNGEDETALHALVTCPFATLCWENVLSGVHQDRGSDFNEWMASIINFISLDMRELVFTVCWAIWKARNEKHWNKKQMSINGVLAMSKQHLVQWREAQERSTEALTRLRVVGDGANAWAKPQVGVIKVSVDAATFIDNSGTGMGMVARNSKGELIQAVSKFTREVVSPELAEAMAIKEAFSWIKSNLWQEVIMESDCMVPVQAIRSNMQMRSPFGLVVEDCRNTLLLLNKVSLFFVRRSANMAAHFIVRESYSFPDRVIDMSNVPIDFMNVLMDDLS